MIYGQQGKTDYEQWYSTRAWQPAGRYRKNHKNHCQSVEYDKLCVVFYSRHKIKYRLISGFVASKYCDFAALIAQRIENLVFQFLVELGIKVDVKRIVVFVTGYRVAV